MTYETLSEDIQSWLQNQSVELAGERDEIISNAIETCVRDLPIHPFIVQQSGNFAQGVPTLLRTDLPRVIALREWSYLKNGLYQRLEFRQESYARMFWPDADAEAPPRFYYVDTGQSWRVAPTPDTSYPYTIEYLQRPLLNENIRVNWFTEHAYNLLLHATLAEACKFTQSVSAETTAALMASHEEEYQRQLGLVKQAEFGLEMDAAKV